MSTAELAREKPLDADPQIEAFLRDLTQLSLQYKIGIAGNPILFCLEDEDLDRTYSSDADSALVY